MRTHEGICRESSWPSCSICGTEDQPWASLWWPDQSIIKRNVDQNLKIAHIYNTGHRIQLHVIEAAAHNNEHKNEILIYQSERKSIELINLEKRIWWLG